jgi:hypothetical protein
MYLLGISVLEEEVDLCLVNIKDWEMNLQEFWRVRTFFGGFIIRPEATETYTSLKILETKEVVSR